MPHISNWRARGQIQHSEECWGRKWEELANYTSTHPLSSPLGKLVVSAGIHGYKPLMSSSPTLESLMYPYGTSQGDTKNAKIDDGTSSEIHITVPFTFYGKKYHSLYVRITWPKWLSCFSTAEGVVVQNLDQPTSCTRCPLICVGLPRRGKLSSWRKWVKRWG